MRKDIIRKGDKVKVKIPSFVHRVGYPKTVEDYLPKLRERYGTHLNTLFSLVSGNTGLVNTSIGKWSEPTKQRSRVEQELAYLMAKQDHFGGRERTIHWVHKPEYEGVEMIVVGVRSAYTGTYFPPTGGGYDSWTGEWDYEPGGLTKMKCHRIARVRFIKPTFVVNGVLQEGFTKKGKLGIEIPVYNLEKL